MRNAVTISLPPKLKKDLDRVTALEGVSRSDVIRECLRDQLFLLEFRALRKKGMARARKRGIFTDEDVFKLIS